MKNLTNLLMKNFTEWWKEPEKPLARLSLIGIVGLTILWVSGRNALPYPNDIIKFFQQYPVLKYIVAAVFILIIVLLPSYIIFYKKHKTKYERFEDIKYTQEITYGPIDYEPLLYHKGSITGIGMTILEKIFPKEQLKASRNWKTNTSWEHFERLFYKEDEIDIIATPLFETRDRSKSALFCSPIFFSEVGIYVKKKGDLYDFILKKMEKERNKDATLSPDLRVYKDMREKNLLIFKHALEAIEEFSQKDKRKLKVKCIEGEISEKLVRKRLKNISNIDPVAKKVPELIDTVVDGSSDVVFIEVFQAELSSAFKDVVNILAPKELLYPVSFAVRKEEYVLKNYINLEMLKIGREGVLDIIIEELESQPYGHSLVNTIKHSRNEINRVLGIELNEDKKGFILENGKTVKDQRSEAVYKVKLIQNEINELIEEIPIIQEYIKHEDKKIEAILNKVEENGNPPIGLKAGESVALKEAIDTKKVYFRELEIKKDKIKNYETSLESVEKCIRNQIERVERYFLPALPEKSLSTTDSHSDDSNQGQRARKG